MINRVTFKKEYLSLFLWFLGYVENTRCHSLNCPYSNDVPGYLHNTPETVFDTARHKISLAQDIPAPDIRTTDNNGEFRVNSQDADKQLYLVSFGNEIE